MAPSKAEWEAEREHLLEIIRKQEEEAARVAKRFKLLQKALVEQQVKALVEQQVVLDQYQQALFAAGRTTADPPAAPLPSTTSLFPPAPSHSLLQSDVTSPSRSIAEAKKPKQRPTEHRAVKTEHTEDKENAFPYLEVVRNREQRAALPGHDCDECRKYYEALDGLVPESEIKARCSRHRARHEPYQTPDDFWRLSFPDSEAAPFSP
ncbi:hypothetical protein ATCC90586_009081 [Pythium insidiosum]|nr:hypothetical protein ATCC90586_009081 [Pythium insidiosum]